MDYSFYVAELFCCLDMTHFSTCSRPGRPLMQFPRLFLSFFFRLPTSRHYLPTTSSATTTPLNYLRIQQTDKVVLFSTAKYPLHSGAFRCFPLLYFPSFLSARPSVALDSNSIFLYSSLPIQSLPFSFKDTDIPVSTFTALFPSFLFPFLLSPFPSPFTSSSRYPFSIDSFFSLFLYHPFASLLHSLSCYREPSLVSFFYHFLLRLKCLSLLFFVVSPFCHPSRPPHCFMRCVVQQTCHQRRPAN